MDEIPYDRSEMGPGKIGLQVDFDQEELDRLYQAIGHAPGIIPFIKQAALEKADAEAARQSQPPIEAAD